MATITRFDGKKWIKEEIVILPKAPRKPSAHRQPDEATIVGILNYLKLAESDWQRYRDVLDQFMKEQSAATMKEVAARRMKCGVPRTKVDAKRLLLLALNLSTLSKK